MILKINELSLQIDNKTQIIIEKESCVIKAQESLEEIERKLNESIQLSEIKLKEQQEMKKQEKEL